MLGTVAFSDETKGCDRSPKLDGGEPASDFVLHKRSDYDTNPSTIVTHQEGIPADSTSTTLHLVKQEDIPSSSLEARYSPYCTGQGDGVTCSKSADNKPQMVYQPIQIRPTQKRETSLRAENVGENKVIAPFTSNGQLGDAAPTCQPYDSSPHRSGTLESASLAMSKSRPLDATPAYPTEIDVIFGRGEPTRKHPGNVIFREHVNKWLDEYMKGSKTTKSSIIRRVIDDVASSGARYLVPLNATCRLTIFTAGCREARKSEIRSKVSHAFRDGERRILLLQRGKEGDFENVSSGKQQKNYATNEIGGACSDHRTHDVVTTVGMKPPAAMTRPSNNDTQHEFRGPAVAYSPKRKSLMQRPVTDLANEETDAMPLSLLMPPRDLDMARPSSDPVSTSTDLLSFANILTSLRRNSRPQSPPADGLHLEYAPVTGVPSDLATVSDDEKKQQQQQQREIQSKKDTNKHSSPIVQSLEKFCRECDIVFGRGAPLRQHPGNIRFRRIVSKYNKKYGDASKHEKTAIIQNVIRELQSDGAKFLMMDDSSGVTEASSDEIRMKVSHRFRDYTKGKSSNLKSKTNENNKMSASTPVVAPSTLSNGGDVLIEV